MKRSGTNTGNIRGAGTYEDKYKKPIREKYEERGTNEDEDKYKERSTVWSYTMVSGVATSPRRAEVEYEANK